MKPSGVVASGAIFKPTLVGRMWPECPIAVASRCCQPCTMDSWRGLTMCIKNWPRLIPSLWVSARTSVQEVSLHWVTWEFLGLVQFTRSWNEHMICSDNGSMMRKKVAKSLNLASNASRLLRFLIARVIQYFRTSLDRLWFFFVISFPPCYRNMFQATIFSCAWRARSWLRRSLQMAECFASECLHQWNCHLVRKVPRKSVNGIGCQKIVHTFCPPPTICSLDQGRDNKTIFDLMKWAADSANAFYRGLHGHGVWIPRAEVGWLCVCGWGVTDP